MSNFPTNSAISLGQQIQDPTNQRNMLLNKKKGQPRKGPRVRQVIDQALLDQGIDPDQTRNDLRANKELIRESQRQRIQLGQSVRDARRSGDADRLAAAQGQVTSLVGQERELLDQRRPMIQLTAPSMSRLTRGEQQRMSDQGRERLLNQLPNVAASARDQATAGILDRQASTAVFGRQAIGSLLNTPADDFTDQEASEYFLSLPRNEQERFTRGVPLQPFPTDRVANADRLEELAQTRGIEFSDRERPQQAFDPFLIRNENRRQIDQFGNQVRGENAARNLSRAGESESENLLLQSQIANRQGQIDLGNIGRDDRVGDAEAVAAEADARQRAQRSGTVLEIDRRTRDQQIEAAVLQLPRTQQEDFSKLPAEIPADERVRMEFDVPDSLVSARGRNATEEIATAVESTLTDIQIARETLTPAQAKEWAKRTLSRIAAGKTDNNPIDDPGITKSLLSRTADFLAQPHPAISLARGSDAPIWRDSTAPERVDIARANYKKAIRELQAMAGVNE